MTRAIIDTAAFCLHSRPYRESSVIVQFFSEHQGRFSAIVKSVKSGSKKNGTLLPLLQPFIPLAVSYTGKLDLKTLLSAELNGQSFMLKGQALFAGLYVNELLVRLLPEHIEYSEIYPRYQQTLMDLQKSNNIESPLRLFEKYLLEHLGYGVPFVEVDEHGHSIGLLQDSETYRFVTESGFVRCMSSQQQSDHQVVFKGRCLLAIARDDLKDLETLFQAKQLMRMVMAQRLGYKPLNSKLLFV